MNVSHEEQNMAKVFFVKMKHGKHVHNEAETHLMCFTYKKKMLPTTLFLIKREHC